MDSLIETSIGVCNYMLDPASPGGIPRTLVSKCAGVAIFHSVSAAAFVSVSSASGILLRRDDGMDEWSPPSAVSIKDVGVGITFGVKKSDIIMVLMDDDAVKTMCAEVGLKLGSNVTVVAGPLASKGKAADYDGDIILSKEGTGITYCYCLSEGVLAGFDINAGVIVVGRKVNLDFYQAEATPEDILFKKGSVSIPSSSRLPELHKKLNMMEKGLVNLQQL